MAAAGPPARAGGGGGPVPGLGGATMALAAAVYLATAFASIPGGDSGELVAEACTLGHAHPPGYPLFTMLYHAVTVGLDVLPGPPAWRANAATAALGALAAGVLQASMLELVGVMGLDPGPEHAIMAAGLALGFALSPLVWMYSTGAEVFALNNFLVAVLVWLALRYLGARDPAKRDFFVNLGAFWSGLALCNQHTAVLFEVPLIACILAHELRRGRVGPAQLARWGALFFVGLAPYIYLPVALLTNRQPGSWGDTTTVSGFVHHLRRGDYGTFRLFSKTKEGDMGMWGRIGLYVEDLVGRQGAVIIPFLAFAGAAILLTQTFAGLGGKAEKKKLPRALANTAAEGGREDASKDDDVRQRRALAGPALVGALLFYVLVFHFLSNMPMDQELLRGIQARFWMQPNMLVYLLAIVPLASQASTLCASGGGKIALAAAVAIAVVLPGYQWTAFHNVSDQSKNTYMEDNARALVAGIPADSLLIVGFDQHWTTLRYLQQCEGFRPDLAIVNGPMLTYAWQASYYEAYARQGKCLRMPRGYWVHSNTQPYVDKEGFSTVELFAANLASCPGGVYFTGRLSHATDTAYNQTYALHNVGLVTRVVPKAEDPSFDAWLETSLAAWSKATAALKNDLPPLAKYAPDTWEWTLRRDFFDHLYNDAQRILEHGVEKKDNDLVAYAAATFRNGYEHDRAGLSDSDLKNLGLAYVTLARTLPQPDADGAVKIERNPLLAALQGQHLRTVFRDQPSNAWHHLCAEKTVLYWKEYLKTPGARADPQRQTVETMVSKLQEIVSKAAAAAAAKKSASSPQDE